MAIFANGRRHASLFIMAIGTFRTHIFSYMECMGKFLTVFEGEDLRQSPVTRTTILLNGFLVVACQAGHTRAQNLSPGPFFMGSMASFARNLLLRDMDCMAEHHVGLPGAFLESDCGMTG